MARALAVTAILGSAAAVDPWLGDDPAPRAFRAFLGEHERKYSGKEELARRFEAFADNYAFVQETNVRNYSYKLNLNQFADLTHEEFRTTHLGFKYKAGDFWAGVPYLGLHTYDGDATATDMDWVTKGAVTPIKDQGDCGSCWSFSATGALEGASFLAGNGLMNVSEQQLVDCSHNGTMGCRGANNVRVAFDFLITTDVCSEASYAYTGRDGTCKQQCEVAIPKGAILGYKRVQADSEEALLNAVMQQPVSVLIEADSLVFQLYSKGILHWWCGTMTDHAVLAVGFGKGYWKVKNSWGVGWGEKGYVRLARGWPGSGKCGIQSDPVYPVVKKFRAAKASSDSMVVV